MLSSPSMTYMKSNIDKKQIKKILINTGDQEKLNTLGIDKGGISKNQNWSVESKFHLLKSGGKQENKKNYIAQKISTGRINPGELSSYITLRPTGQTNALNNPLYELRLYANGQLINRFLTVTGRRHTQNRNRHQSGTEAPLPDGKYTVSISTIRGSIAEAGDQFLPIWPLFKTGRTDLGFHVDPSFEKNNGEDGTSGCIGLISKQHLSQVVTFVRTYRPKFIDVRIQ
ncbi:L,D-transpeptidase [Calothrix rhizosoleniae]|uniref:L,D-transpeptidase n=1 Tax=Calothrix rhizosoleniae TaxID=888997 RepID=UPI001177A79E|nr:L,D-transpeptidase [Calothrix rhizosoleniae]